MAMAKNERKVSQKEVKALADAMKANGQHEHVHVLPDGTIVLGHARVCSARLLGWADLAVVVRHDLG
jgi:ParB-like chromosome segregation protein Spo0J